MYEPRPEPEKTELPYTVRMKTIQKRASVSETKVRLVIAVLAGLVVFVLLVPSGCVEPIPPQCWSYFGYGVPYGEFVPVAAAVITSVVVGLALWLLKRGQGQE